MPSITLSSEDIGKLLQEKYSNKIVIINTSIDHCDGDIGDTFIMFDTEDELINYFAIHIVGDLILYEDKYDRYIRENTLVEFNDDDLQIDLITYKTSGERISFVNSDLYNMMKKEIEHEIKMTQSEYYSDN